MPSAIAKAYARRIVRGEITIDNVPERIRDEVRSILEETSIWSERGSK